MEDPADEMVEVEEDAPAETEAQPEEKAPVGLPAVDDPAFETVDVEEEVEEEAAPEVPEVEAEKPVVETKAEKAVRLAALRNEKGELDEDRIEELEKAAQELGSTTAALKELYRTDPDYRLAYIKSRQKQGLSLLPEQLAELNAVKPAEPAKPAEKQYTEAEIFAEYDKQAAAGKSPGWLAQFLDHWIHKPREAKRLELVESERKARLAREEADTKAAQESTQLRTWKSEAADAAKGFKDIWIPDKTLAVGYRCADKRVAEMLPRFPGLSIREATTAALALMGRLKAKTVAGAKTRTPIQNIKPTPKKEKVDPQYELVDVD